MGNEDYKALAKELKSNVDIMNDTFAGFGLQFQRFGIQFDGEWGNFLIEFSGTRLSKDMRVHIILYDKDDNLHYSNDSFTVGHKNFGSYGVAKIMFRVKEVFPDAVSGRIFAAGV